MKIPGLENLEDIPRKTDEMLASLDRLERLLRVLIEIQATTAGGGIPWLEEKFKKQGLSRD
jgi:hypothetical protein